MTRTYCDICGKEIASPSYDDVSEFKVKKLVHSWHENWWERMTVHTTCWMNLCDFLKAKAEAEEEESK